MSRIINNIQVFKKNGYGYNEFTIDTSKMSMQGSSASFEL